MILLTILALMLVMLIGIAVIFISVGGTVFTVIFADVFVCIGFIVLVIRFLIKRKRKK